MGEEKLITLHTLITELKNIISKANKNRSSNFVLRFDDYADNETERRHLENSNNIDFIINFIKKFSPSVNLKFLAEIEDDELSDTYHLSVVLTDIGRYNIAEFYHLIDYNSEFISDIFEIDHMPLSIADEIKNKYGDFDKLYAVGNSDNAILNSDEALSLFEFIKNTIDIDLNKIKNKEKIYTTEASIKDLN